MPPRYWKVGELAKRTGLTVRALHHYDAIGLLCPSGRSGSSHGSGHRLYTASDVARLQQIVSLKALGFSLDQVRDYLARGDFDPREIVQLHREWVQRQADDLKRLADRLSALADALDRADVVSADTFLTMISEMTMIEKYYTPEQLEQLQARKHQVGEERIKEVEAAWPRLMAAVQAEMDAGTDPADTKIQEYARQWVGLINEFTGGNAGIERSLKTMYQNEDHIHSMDVTGMRPMFEYIREAATAAGLWMPGA